MKKTTEIFLKVERLAQLEVFIAIICILMPLFLRWADGRSSFRDSISNYVYMENAHVFGFFITAAALMFIYNGVLYFEKEKRMETLSAVSYSPIELPTGKYYNIVLGLGLLGVLFFPHENENFKVIHYIFAGVFFAGSIIVMAFLSEKKHRKTGIFLATCAAIALLLYFINETWINLFWAEWIALIAIGIHYIIESQSSIGSVFDKIIPNV